MTLPTEDGIAFLRLVSDNEEFVNKMSDGSIWIQEVVAKMQLMGKMKHISVTRLIAHLDENVNVLPMKEVYKSLFGESTGDNGVTYSSIGFFVPKELENELIILIGLRSVKYESNIIDRTDLKYNGKIIASYVSADKKVFNPPLILSGDYNSSEFELTTYSGYSGAQFEFIAFIGRLDQNFIQRILEEAKKDVNKKQQKEDKVEMS